MQYHWLRQETGIKLSLLILFGGKTQILVKSFDILSVGEISFVDSDQDMIATSCRSMLMNAHGVNGTLYRTGEHILSNGTVVPFK